MKLGEAIKLLRKEKGLTQRELAYKCEISTNALCSIEKDYSFPSKETVRKLAMAFSVPTAYILLISLTEEDVPESKRHVFKKIHELLKELLLS